MRFLVVPFLTLALSVSFVPLHVEAASKKIPVVHASQEIQDATVNLYCRFKVGKKYFSHSGSGVFIDSKGVILTNAHVAQYFLIPEEKRLVKGWCSVRTGSPANKRYTASVLYMPTSWAKNNIGDGKISSQGTGEHDFALLYITGAEKHTDPLPESFPVISLDILGAVEENTKVTVLGYPTTSLDFDGVRSSLYLEEKNAPVLRSSGFTNTSKDFITVDAGTMAAEGISGGPLLDIDDELVAITSGRSDTLIRAITLSYIYRSILSETGFSLSTLLQQDFKTRAILTKLLLPQDTGKNLSNSILKQR